MCSVTVGGLRFAGVLEAGRERHYGRRFHCRGGCEHLVDCAAFVLFRFAVPRDKLNLRSLKQKFSIFAPERMC